MAFIDDFLGSLGTVAGGLADRYLGTNFLSQQAAQQANQFSAQQAQINRDWQQRMMEMQNQWNSPAAQMQRARDAGLNPSLLYGNPVQEAASPSGGSAPAGVQATGANGAGDLVSSVQQGLFMKKQADLLDAQVDNVKADTKNKGAQTSKIGAEIKAIDKSLEVSDAQIAKLRSDQNLANALGIEAGWRTNHLINQLALFNETFEAQKTAIEAGATLTRLEADNWLRECNSRISQMNALTDYYSSLKDLNETQKEYVQEMKNIATEQQKIVAKQAEIITKYGNTKEVLSMINSTLISSAAFMQSIASIFAAANRVPTLNQNFGGTNTFSVPVQ